MYRGKIDSSDRTGAYLFMKTVKKALRHNRCIRTKVEARVLGGLLFSIEL